VKTAAILVSQPDSFKGARQIMAEEIQRYREEGLLRIDPKRNVGGHRRQS
jgi:hypothetical protein